MQMIAAVEIRANVVRMRRVLGRFIEIDDTIERPAGADPLVDSFALGFFGFGEVAFEHCAGEGRQSRSIDFESLFMRASSELFESGNDIGGVGLFAWEEIGAGMAEIVDAFEHDYVFHAGLREHVAIEAGKRADAESDVLVGVAQDAITADSFVDNRDMATLDAAGEEVGPAMVGVFSGGSA